MGPAPTNLFRLQQATRVAGIPDGDISTSLSTPAEQEQPAPRETVVDGGSVTVLETVESIPGGRLGTVPAPDVEVNPSAAADKDAGVAVPTTEGGTNGSNGNAGDKDNEGRQRQEDKAQSEKNQHEDKQAKIQEIKHQAEVTSLTNQLQDKESRINNTSKSMAQMEAALEEKRKAFADWTVMNFIKSPQTQVIRFGTYRRRTFVEDLCLRTLVLRGQN